jgi:hypothetical protein
MKRRIVERSQRLDIRDFRRRGIVEPGRDGIRIVLPDGNDPTIHIIWRPMPFGGARAFFRCFDCLEPCEILFLPRMTCKSCEGAAYRSENLSRFNRIQERLRKLRAKAGADFTGPIPAKPKRMRWATYDSLLAQIKEADAAHTAAWLGSRSAAALLRRRGF